MATLQRSDANASGRSKPGYWGVVFRVKWAPSLSLPEFQGEQKGILFFIVRNATEKVGVAGLLS